MEIFPITDSFKTGLLKLAIFFYLNSSAFAKLPGSSKLFGSVEFSTTGNKDKKRTIRLPISLKSFTKINFYPLRSNESISIIYTIARKRIRKCNMHRVVFETFCLEIGRVYKRTVIPDWCSSVRKKKGILIHRAKIKTVLYTFLKPVW